MHPLLQKLTGGDRRSIGSANEVAALVLVDPAHLAVLFEGMASIDPILRMRCADVAEKVTASHPDWLLPFKNSLLRTLSRIPQQEVRWHIAPMLVRLPLSESEALEALNILRGYMDDRSAIVRTLTMQAMADLAVCHRTIRSEVISLIETHVQSGTPAMRTRGKKVPVSSPSYRSRRA
mgnify:CR=1 FL=1